MSHKVKPKNPEAALQASMAREVQLRLMDEAVARQGGALAVARWECALGQKDVLADRKRRDQNQAADAVLKNKSIKATRKQRLEDLFKAEELAYEEELAMSGFAFRRTRA
jgi:hypothetical protein